MQEYSEFPYVYEQYLKSSTAELLQGFAVVKNKHVGAAFDTIKRDIIDLKTAKGNALDEWGRMLNFSRFIPALTAEAYEKYKYQMTDEDRRILFGESSVNTFSFYEKNFINLTFAVSSGYDPAAANFGVLDDETYRKLLQYIYQTQNASIDAGTLKAFLDGFFNLNVEIRDVGNMSFDAYFFVDYLPVWLQWVFECYDLLPRPSGVQANLKRGSFKYFNFATNDDAYNLENVGNFAFSIFKS